MDKLKKFELMEKVVRQLEDLQNSQQAILEKISNIEVENIEIGDKRLETLLPEIHQRSADNLDVVRDLVEEFAAKTDDFGETNNVARLREQQEINSTK
ncbi:hypothetical protein [Olivibacter sp. XZL3]|uniref:hypothetical protein n=1 Tax=Olivibacter sp. XZL3 TaxID=1735116 RepID=UPI001065A29E|nr:hypothetical protein [Olivibacter sp. XZL3]